MQQDSYNLESSSKGFSGKHLGTDTLIVAALERADDPDVRRHLREALQFREVTIADGD